MKKDKVPRLFQFVINLFSCLFELFCIFALKVRVVLNTVKEILASRNYETSDKLIIVSQWASFLDAIGKCLNEMPKVKYSKFTGKVAVKDRQVVRTMF